MCGIAGLFLKGERHRDDLGRLCALMLHEMRERGPDSAGFAVYGPESELTKITVLARDADPDWPAICEGLATFVKAEVEAQVTHDHAVLEMIGDGRAARGWLIDNRSEVEVLSYGHRIELFKAVGDPDRVAEIFGLAQRSGTHAIAHTRMATESAVTTAGSHPFATGEDMCLVHNGSLSNHHWLRDELRYHGETFQTENDSEVAAGYVAWRLREGDTLAEALEKSLIDLDGFFTFAIGVRDGFAVLRDPIACKPAVLAETDDWVAMSSEFRAIAQLPGVEHAEVWEPAPAVVYSWNHQS